MNVAIIGCNVMGRLHARMAENCGLKVIVCADKRKKMAAALAKKYKACADTDCRAVIRRHDVDIVGIMTPTPTHTKYIVAAAEAGKHVFCEKPLGRSLDECKEAIAAVKKANVKLFVGHVVRYFHEFEAMKAQVAAGKLGKVGFVKLYRGGIFPRGVGKWYRDYEQSGGVTLDSMIHDIDWLRYVFGDAARVFCQVLLRSKPQPLDYSMATFRMKNGIIAHVTGTWSHPGGFRVRAEICGDKGMAQFDSADTALSVMMRAKPDEGPGMVVPGSPVVTSPYQLEWEDFLRWVRGEGEPRVKPEDALEAIRMALAALTSAKTGEPVTL
jgi:predicted dehydrogenase